MFIGHFAVGFAVKKLAPKSNLATNFIAVQFLDLLWPPLLLLGVERVAIEPGNTAVTPLNFISYPYSHSLLMTALWATLVAGVYFLVRKEKREAMVLWFAVLSHWILDVITHRPDLPLTPGSSSFFGFGLWNSVAATVIIEGGLFALGIYFYTIATKVKNKKGIIGFWSLIAFLLLIYCMNLFGPPPPNVEAIPWAGLSLWLLVLWAWWVERNREELS
ncbi:MAG: hypothetical protein HY960_07435 [Ignavibacteriae bacterium]|nr:hypothetical protein [Ignavibacteriota bacterium]